MTRYRGIVSALLLGAGGVWTALSEAGAPGVRVTSIGLASNGLAVGWVARGGGETNALLASILPGRSNGTAIVAVVAPAGGVPPWYDVAVTSVVPTTLPAAFFQVGGPSLPAPGDAPALSAAPDQRSPGAVAWSIASTGLVAIYQFQAAPGSNFEAEVMETWPMGSVETIPVLGSTDLFCRVRAWNYPPEAGGLASAWSSSRVYRILLTNAPHLLTVPAVTTQRQFSIAWQAPALTAIHQVQHTPDPAFASEVAETWPQGTQEMVLVAQNGVRHFRVRSWSRPPEQGGAPTDWTPTAACTALVQLAAPAFTNIPASVSGPFAIGWTPVPGAAIYELQLRNSGGDLLQSYWPTLPHEPGIPAGPATSIMARVRAWTALPEVGGEDGVWSADAGILVLP